jgi:hypothetical protein
MNDEQKIIDLNESEKSEVEYMNQIPEEPEQFEIKPVKK